MAMTSGENSNGSIDEFTASGASRPKRTVLHAQAARAPGAGTDTVSLSDTELDGASAAGLPERKYSFNALIAMGLAGFVIGRICAR